MQAARKLRKELVRLFEFAKKAKMRTMNPVEEADRVKLAGERSNGRYSWSEADIAQYRARHKLGTRARLAMELLLWAGQRRSDGVWLGPADMASDYAHGATLERDFAERRGITVRERIADMAKAVPENVRGMFDGLRLSVKPPEPQAQEPEESIAAVRDRAIARHARAV